VQRPPLLPAPSIFACTLSPPSLHAFPPPLEGHALSCPGFAVRAKTPASFLINLHPTPSSPRAPRETFRRRFSPTVPRARQSVPLHDGGRVKLFPVRPSVLACIPPPSLPAFPPFVWHGEFRHMPSATDSFRWTETRRTSSLQITARHSCQRFKSRLQRSMDFKPFGNATCPSNVKAPMIPDSAKSE